MKLHKKIPTAILALSTLAITTGCGASLTHPINYQLHVYEADLNHNGKIDDNEKNLTWAESYDALINQTTSVSELKKAADAMNIATDGTTATYREALARYEILHQAEELLMNTGIELPIYNYEDPFMLKETVTGLYCSGLGYKFFESMERKNGNNRFNVCIGSKAATMDPTKNSTVEAATMLCQALMGMKRWTSDPTEAKPFNCKLANGCGVSIKDETSGSVTWRMYIGKFTLKSGCTGEKLSDYVYDPSQPIVWQDGTPVTPLDFVMAWNRAASSSAGTSFSEMFNCIQGYDEWHEKEAKEITYESLKNGMSGLSIGQATETLPSYFEAKLNADCGYFDELLSFPAFMPLPFHTMVQTNSEGVKEIDSGWWTYPNAKGQIGGTAAEPLYFCGNGPLKFETIDNLEGGKITLVKNDKYVCCDPDPVTTQHLTFHLIDDDVNMLNKYINNELDFIDAIAAGSVDDMKAKYPKEYLEVEQIALYYYLFNVNDNTFDMAWNANLSDAEQERKRESLRKVMVLLVNRNDICKSIGKAGQTPSSGIVSSGVIEKALPRRGDASVGEDPDKIYVRVKPGTTEPISGDWQERNNYTKGEYNRFEKRDSAIYEDGEFKGISKGFFYTYDGKTDTEHYDERVKYVIEQNINYAIELAKSAGVTYDEQTGKFVDFPEIKLTMNTGTGHEQVAERMQYYYSLFGITLRVETQEWNSFCAAKKNGDFALGRNGWVADFTDPKTYLDTALSTSNNNEMQIGKEKGAYIHISK